MAPLEKQTGQRPETVSRWPENVADAVFDQAFAGSGSITLEPITQFLCRRLNPGDTILVSEPHADDVLGCAGLVVGLIKVGFRVIEAIFYAGTDCSGFPSHFVRERRAAIRRAEAGLASLWFDTQLEWLDLESYYNACKYIPSHVDYDKVAELIGRHKPSAILCAPSHDGHAAHRAVRALTAVGLLYNQLRVPVIDYWTPWGPLPRPDSFAFYDCQTADLKRKALRYFVSQPLDYASYCGHLERAYACLLSELKGGHHLDAAVDGGFSQPAGVELYRVLETFDVNAFCGVHPDPILTVLGILEGVVEEQPPFRCLIDPPAGLADRAARAARTCVDS
ncbi:MAG: hypothetical protein QGG09_20750 [Pirellulaceae bacterium]|nr:hypothetical protein [Pirellulaceae bacterium]HJN13081.1 hypothetical protein [Pirellulaceae bacterium]